MPLSVASRPADAALDRMTGDRSASPQPPLHAGSIVEPSWSGVRVLARVNKRSRRIIDEDGIDCTAEFAAIASAVAARAGFQS